MTQAWILGAVSILCSGAALAQTTYHVGVGAGPEYGGLGATIERVTDNDKITVGGGLVNSHRIAGEAYDYGSRAGETASGLNITFGYRFN